MIRQASGYSDVAVSGDRDCDDIARDRGYCITQCVNRSWVGGRSKGEAGERVIQLRRLKMDQKHG